MGQAIIVKGADYSANNLGQITVPYNVPYSAQAIAYLTAVDVAQDSDKGMKINNFIHGLITNSLWDKIQAAYPFEGSTALKANINLINPSQSASLVDGNIVSGGVSLAINTTKILLNDNITVTSTGHICAYNKTLESTTGIKLILSSNSAQTLIPGSYLGRTLINEKTGAGAFISSYKSFNNVNEIGTLIGSFNGTTQKVYSKAIEIGSVSASPQGGSIDALYLGLHEVAVANYNTSCIISYVSIGEGLTPEEVVIYDGLINQLVADIH